MSIAIGIHKKYIRGTQEKAIVVDKTFFFCHLTNEVERALTIPKQVYLKTRVLKHIYDKKPAQEYDFLLSNIHALVKYPDNVYKNKSPQKRGEYCFTKMIDGNNFLCCLENLPKGSLFIVTAFRVRKESYLKDYTLLWSRRSDIPSS